MPGGVGSAEDAYRFDVVSIHQNKTEGEQRIGPTNNGYQAINMGLLDTIQKAYLPLTNNQSYYTKDRIKGAPDWILSSTADRYNIDARIADKDQAAWADPARQQEILQSMLRAMLADRTKLFVHRETREAAVFELRVSKGGPKFKESDPHALLPEGIGMAAGGVLARAGSGRAIRLFGASMASLAQVLSNYVGHPVVDKTGLTGRYDIVVEREERAEGSAPNPGPPAFAVDALGLHLERAKSPVDTLVIDHVERPSEN